MSITYPEKIFPAWIQYRMALPCLFGGSRAHEARWHASVRSKFGSAPPWGATVSECSWRGNLPWSRVVVLWVALGKEPCSDNTGAYCRARAKLPLVVLQRLTDRKSTRLNSSHLGI